MVERLNVLLVVIAGARADHLGSQGYSREATPFLDSLAREGVRFSSAFATSPCTLPSHASLFSGLFTSTHGASDENPFFDGAHASLPEVLRQAGYRTSAFCSDRWVSPATGFGRGFEEFHTSLGDGRSMARAAFYARRATDRLLRRSDAGARRTNLALLDWLGGGEDPFFAFVHYGEPRLHRQPPAPYERMFLRPQIGRGPLKAIEREMSREEVPQAERDKERREILDGLYDGALRYADSRLQEVARHLQESGQWDRTLVVVTADHGHDLGEHAPLGPSPGLYDSVLHVPLLLRCPPRVPQGFVVEETAQHVDVAPTILELVGLPDEMAGVHGRPLLRQGRVTPGPAFAVAERFRQDLEVLRKQRPGEDLRHFDVRERALRTRREKFIWRSDEQNEFYDLSTDPGERHNCIADAGPRAAALRTQLFNWLAGLERHTLVAAAVEEGERQQA